MACYSTPAVCWMPPPWLWAVVASASRASTVLFAGYDDWHLPNAKALHSLVASSRSRSTINAILFDNKPSPNAVRLARTGGQLRGRWQWGRHAPHCQWRGVQG